MTPEDSNPFVESFYKGARRALEVAKDPRALKAVCSKANHELDGVFAEQLSRSGSTIACCAGCFYCCHLKVDVRPGEAFLIADFIRARFSPERLKAILQRAEENWKKIRPMNLRQQFFANLPCPLLEDGRCSVYLVRPGICRIQHSRRVEPCKESFERPELLSLPAEPAPSVKFATASADLGVTRAFEDSGYDAKAYDLNAALIETLTNPHSEKRWRDGKAAFPRIMLAKDQQEKNQAGANDSSS